MSVATPKFGMGASAMRVEDSAFVAGRGSYAGGIKPEGAPHGCVLLSPAAGESFAIGSPGEGRAAPGVRLKPVGADIGHIDMPGTPARLWAAASGATQ